jgi:hypothetical protein
MEPVGSLLGEASGKHPKDVFPDPARLEMVGPWHDFDRRLEEFFDDLHIL